MRFYFDNQNNTYAIKTYRGKTIKGVAKLSHGDTYNPLFGMQLAGLRCEQKWVDRKLTDVTTALINATYEFEAARRKLDKISEKADDLYAQKMDIEIELNELLKEAE